MTLQMINVLFYHETEQSSEYGRYAPRRVPCVWVVVTNGQTQASVGFEPAIWRNHINAGRFERKIPGEHQPAQIVTSSIRGVIRSVNNIVPTLLTNNSYFLLFKFILNKCSSLKL